MTIEKPLAEVVAELRKLDVEATPPPWEWTDDETMVGPRAPDGDMDGRIIETDSGHYPPREPDRALIASVRNALPRLLDALEAKPTLKTLREAAGKSLPAPPESVMVVLGQGDSAATTAEFGNLLHFRGLPALPAPEADPKTLALFDSAAKHANELERVGKLMAEALETVRREGGSWAECGSDVQNALAEARNLKLLP